MNYILYMAMSANGFIADSNDDTPWSEEEWDSLSDKVEEVGNIIIGRRTYEFMLKEGDIEELGNPLVIIFSKSYHQTEAKNHFFVQSVDQAEEILKKHRKNTGLVVGGSKVNSIFINKVSEIILDIEPIIFGSGYPLFHPLNVELELDLLGTKRVGEDGMQLHYRVIKN